MNSDGYRGQLKRIMINDRGGKSYSANKVIYFHKQMILEGFFSTSYSQLVNLCVLNGAPQGFNQEVQRERTIIDLYASLHRIGRRTSYYLFIEFAIIGYRFIDTSVSPPNSPPSPSALVGLPACPLIRCMARNYSPWSSTSGIAVQWEALSVDCCINMARRQYNIHIHTWDLQSEEVEGKAKGANCIEICTTNSTVIVFKGERQWISYVVRDTRWPIEGDLQKQQQDHQPLFLRSSFKEKFVCLF